MSGFFDAIALVFAPILDVLAARPLLWILLFSFATFAGLVAEEALNRKRGLLVSLYALASAASYGAAAAFASS